MLRAFILALAAVGVSSLPQGKSEDTVPVGFGLYAYGPEIGGFTVNCDDGGVFLNRTVAPGTELFTANTSTKTISRAKTGDKLAVPTTPGPVAFVPNHGPNNASFQTSDMTLFGNTLFVLSAAGQLKAAWTAVPIAEDSTAFRLGWNVTSDGAVPLALRTLAPGTRSGATKPETSAIAIAPAS
ncbi:hypothetical protein MCOR02_011336 [Pyricularia oryzae]|uniref:Cell wall protein PhiA n=1 Tax=Pyricularia oryzae TaxID=318829 RepID=A0A4P7NCK0_PYROR|nr:hypothetical protein MCOR02_011336 [Pyricularia oryzae]QBZ58340.1 hypothetical protein PoMZ_03292 [Pyricularia oryzae]